MLFLEICQFVLDLFSRNFFKSNFFDPVLQMASVRKLIQFEITLLLFYWSCFNLFYLGPSSKYTATHVSPFTFSEVYFEAAYWQVIVTEVGAHS